MEILPFISPRHQHYNSWSKDQKIGSSKALRGSHFSLQVIEKQRATLELEVNEDDVEGRWMKNGVEIKFPVETRFMYTTIRRLHRLTISETFRSDAGEYTFLAGRNQSSMNLLVRRKHGKRSSHVSIHEKKKNHESVCHVPTSSLKEPTLLG